MLFRLAALLYIGLFGLSPAQAEGLLTVTKPVPGFHYKDDKSESVSFDAKAARFTAVHFWATWCTPCLAELPKLNAVAAAHEKEGFRVVAISMDTNIDKVKQFIADKKLTHIPANIDEGMNAFSAFHLRGLPSTIFVTGEGQQTTVVEGPLDWESEAVKVLIEARVKGE